jgi:hypothetical protein
MASIAQDRGLTLAPFRRLYGDFRDIMLSDSLFTIPDGATDARPAGNSAALLPQVIALPSRVRFETAVNQWQHDIMFDSLPDEMKGHASFMEIIAEGSRVVPLIAAHLRKEPSFLFLALEEIFGEDPVPEDAYGDLTTTVSAWLQWLQR